MMSDKMKCRKCETTYFEEYNSFELDGALVAKCQGCGEEYIIVEEKKLEGGSEEKPWIKCDKCGGKAYLTYRNDTGEGVYEEYTCGCGHKQVETFE